MYIHIIYIHYIALYIVAKGSCIQYTYTTHTRICDSVHPIAPYMCVTASMRSKLIRDNKSKGIYILIILYMNNTIYE